MFSNELICKIIEYINQNLYEEIRIDYLSKIFYYDRTYIIKKFKSEIGITIINYVNTLKIYNSLKYLKYDKSILEISLLNGFNSQEYYSETFKNILGISPITYKKYISYIGKLNKKDIEILQDNIIKIELLISNVQKYLNNKKPQVITKKLSLFE